MREPPRNPSRDAGWSPADAHLDTDRPVLDAARHAAQEGIHESTAANAKLALAGFLTAHLALWTTLPLLCLHALPVDLVEGVIWGQGWQLGYDQPPFQAWIVGSLDSLFGYRAWVLFLCSQLLVCTCIWAVWRLARRIVRPWGALISALVLEGVAYFSFSTPNLFPDLIEMPFWTLATWSFYRAVRFGLTRDWVVLGCLLAGAAYAKYVGAVLAAAMIGFMLFELRARRTWRTPGPYLCAAVCLLLLAPHLRWAAEHGFPTVEHIRRVSRPTVGLLDRLLALAGFLGGQIVITMGAGILLTVLARASRGARRIALANDCTSFDRRFVATLALGPILLMISGAALSGVQFRMHWTHAMWSFIGLFAVVFVVPAVDLRSLRRFAVALAGVSLLIAVSYAGANGLASFAKIPRTAGAAADAQLENLLREAQTEATHGLARLQREAGFPSRDLAQAITARWHEKVGGPLPYVIGNKWIAGNIVFFSPDHPLALRDGSPDGSPWIDMADLRRRGAVVAWNPDSDTNDIAATLQRLFPEMEQQRPIVLPWRSGADVPPLRIRWGILRPTSISPPGSAR